MKSGKQSRVSRNSIARAFSLALNAPVVAAFTFLVLLLRFGTLDFPAVYGTAVVFGTVLPLGAVAFFQKRQKLPVLAGEGKRTGAFLAAVLSYSCGVILLSLFNAPAAVRALMFCYLGNSLVMMVVNLVWKISIHASSVTGPATVLVYTMGTPYLPVFLLLLPVGWARVRLKAHSVQQILAGALLTIITTWVQLRIIL